ncbi:MAG: hypothetical protein WA962_01125 [Ornithinimicrobium sp.]
MTGATQPAPFADFVHARAASLNRTAVLLVPDAEGAQNLLRMSLTQARLRWKGAGHSPEAFVRTILVRTFVKHSTQRHLSDGGAHGSMGDPLEGLTARQRAITVLMALHDQSLAQAAGELRISRRAASTDDARAREALFVPALAQLAPILAEVAETFAVPDPAGLLADAERRATAQRNQRRAGWAAACAAVVAAGAGAAVLDSPPEGSGEAVQPPSADLGYAGGYGLVDGEPAPYLDGLALEKTAVIDYGLRGTVVTAPKVDEDIQIYAVAYCDLPGNAMDVDAILDVISVRAGPETVDLSCLDRSADLSTAPLLEPLPRGVDGYTVTVPAAWAGTGAVHLALYREEDWSAYPFGTIADYDTAPQLPGAHDVVNASTALTLDPSLEGLLGKNQQVRSIELDVDTKVDVTALTQEPGQLLVALDGVVITNDGEELVGLGKSLPGPWQDADPQLRQGFWRGYVESGYHRSFESGELSRLGVDITDDTVVVSVVARGFNGAGWQVIANTDGGSAPMALAPGYSPILPEFAHGMRRIAAYQVPTDGEAHGVPLDSSLAEQLTWVGGCGVETPHRIRSLSLHTEFGYGLIPCANYRSEWAGPFRPKGATVQAGLIPDEGGGNTRFRTESENVSASQSVTLTAPETSERTSLTVAAYADVSYDEFPFVEADQPTTSRLNLRPVPDEGGLIGLGLDRSGTKAWTVRNSITQADLDSRGRVELAVSVEEEALLSVATEGKGRFRARIVGEDAAEGLLDGMFYDPSVLGRIASPLMYRDGWWTSWTTEPTEWTIPLPPRVSGREGSVEIIAQDYDPGSLSIRVLEATTDDDTLNG